MGELTPEEIGNKGEWYIDGIDSAELHIYTPQPDRTGKDRVFEWKPTALESGQSYDTQPAARTCIVQIKSVLNTSDKISVKLSAIEWLVKDSRPAFIITPRIKPNCELDGYKMFHLKGVLLAKVLKRLRGETKKNNKYLNRSYISFSLNSGTDLSTDPEQFRQQLEMEIGSSREQYEEDKKKELKTLGYDERPFIFSVSFQGITDEMFIDAYLYGTPLEVSKVTVSEKRFGISLPGSALSSIPAEMKNGKMTFQDSEMTTGYLHLKNNTFGNEISLKCQVLRPPSDTGIPKEKIKFRLVTELIECVLHPEHLDFNISFNPVDRECPILEWHNTLQFLMKVGRSNTQLVVEIPKEEKVLPITLEESMNFFISDDFKVWAGIVTKVYELFEGVNAKDLVVSLEELIEKQKIIYYANEIIKNRFDNYKLSFPIDCTEKSFEKINEKKPILAFFNLEIGQVQLALLLRGMCIFTTSEHKTLILVDSFQFLSVEVIVEEDDYFNCLVKKTQKISGIEDSFSCLLAEVI